MAVSAPFTLLYIWGRGRCVSDNLPGRKHECTKLDKAMCGIMADWALIRQPCLF